MVPNLYYWVVLQIINRCKSYSAALCPFKKEYPENREQYFIRDFTLTKTRYLTEMCDLQPKGVTLNDTYTNIINRRSRIRNNDENEEIYIYLKRIKLNSKGLNESYKIRNYKR